MFWSAQKRQKINSWIPSCENFLHTYFTYPKPFKRVATVHWLSERTSISVHSLSTNLIVSETYFFLPFFLHMTFTEMQNLEKIRFPQLLLLLFWHSQLSQRAEDRYYLKENKLSPKKLSHIIFKINTQPVIKAYFNTRMSNFLHGRVKLF